MKVGIVGLGVMGGAMAGHLLKRGTDEVVVHDLLPEPVARLAALGARPVACAAAMNDAEVVIVIPDADEQVLAIVRELAAAHPSGCVAAIAATVHPATMARAAELAQGSGLRLIDAPVVYGSAGAKAGNLLTLAGGDEADIATARPALMAYSRDVVRIGALGHGQIAKTANNMLHWAHCVGNYEAILLAKAYGLDAQRLREVLLICPATNGTLETWDDTFLTWQEHDMDVVMDLAQSARVTLPLFGQIDQLVKLITHQDIQDLLYGDKASYLGKTVATGAAGAMQKQE